MPPGLENTQRRAALNDLELHVLLVPVAVGPADDVPGLQVGPLDVAEGDPLVAVRSTIHRFGSRRKPLVPSGRLTMPDGLSARAVAPTPRREGLRHRPDLPRSAGFGKTGRGGKPGAAWPRRGLVRWRP